MVFKVGDITLVFLKRSKYFGPNLVQFFYTNGRCFGAMLAKNLDLDIGR